MSKTLITIFLFVPFLALGQRYDKITGKTNFFVFGSAPYMSQFYIRPPGTDRSNGGFLGVSAGAGYHHKPKRFYTWQAGVLTTYSFPVPASVHRAPDKNGHLVTESMIGMFTSFRDNYVWQRFDFGYGLVASRHAWRYTDDYITSNGYRTDETSYVNWGAGLSLSGYYRLGRVFGVGLLYQPLVLSSNTILKYEHLVSLDFRVLVKRRPHQEAVRVQQLKRETEVREQELERQKRLKKEQKRLEKKKRREEKK